LTYAVLIRSRTLLITSVIGGKTAGLATCRSWNFQITVMTTTVSARGNGLSSLNKTSMVIT